MGNGDGTFQAARTFTAGKTIWSVAVGDFNGDGKLDLAVPDGGSNTVSVLLGNGDGTFQAPRSFPVGTGPVSVAVGDFNGDRVQDLAVVNYFDFTVSVLFGNGDGTFRAGGTFAASDYPWSVAVADFNGDGALDLVTANLGSTTVSVLPGNGDGTFQATQNFGAGFGPVFVAVADVNGDGKPDLVVPSYYGRAISVLLGNGQSATTVATPTLNPGSGTYSSPVTVTITDGTPGATIYYTTDGSAPTTASSVYTGPISVTQTTTINAIATVGRFTRSAMATATYTLQAATPTFSPPGGTYLLPRFVSISDSSPGVTIYYTTDGSTPTTDSTTYRGPILVITTTTIKAMAAAPGWSQSPVASATYASALGL